MIIKHERFRKKKIEEREREDKQRYRMAAILVGSRFLLPSSQQILNKNNMREVVFRIMT